MSQHGGCKPQGGCVTREKLRVVSEDEVGWNGLKRDCPALISHQNPPQLHFQFYLLFRELYAGFHAPSTIVYCCQQSVLKMPQQHIQYTGNISSMCTLP